MKFRNWCIPAMAVLVQAGRLGAVYAPVPELERERPLTLYTTVGAYYDTNIFGAPSDEYDSWVLQLAPHLVYNWQPDKQTLVSLGYRLEWDHFLDRPGNRNLDSHRANVRVAHTFSPRVEAEANVVYDITRNPESLLPGLSGLLSRDQSHRGVTADGRVNWTLSRRSAITAKARLATFAYDQRDLATELDRSEVLTGLSWNYSALPRLQTVAEYRAQWISYSTNGYDKDKNSNMVLGGFDYALGRTFGMTFRAGSEIRSRTDGTVARPYAEVGAKWDYAADSFLSTGYAYVIEEVANLARYHDSSVHRLFVNVQHALTSRLNAAVSLNWEPTTLNGRRGVYRNVDERNTMVGLALEYKVTPRWDVFVTWDWDRIKSDDAGRNLERARSGISSRWAF